jgi:hypothetical protein
MQLLGKPLEKIRSLGVPRLQIVVWVLTFLLGLFAKPMLDTLVKPLFSPANIPATIFVLVTVLFAVMIAFWSIMREQMASVVAHLGTLTRYVGQRAQLISHVQGYEEVKKRTQTARKEILKLIYYEVEPTTGKPVYEAELLSSPERKAAYEVERQKLESEKGNDNFRYVEVVQIPYGHGLDDILPFDPIYKESCAFLAGCGRVQSEFASLHTSEVVFPNTFVMIDQSFLYIAFQTKNPDTGSYEYPYVGLVIEDPDSEVVHDISKLFRRIEANSRLITKVKK